MSDHTNQKYCVWISIEFYPLMRLLMGDGGIGWDRVLVERLLKEEAERRGIKTPEFKAWAIEHGWMPKPEPEPTPKKAASGAGPTIAAVKAELSELVERPVKPKAKRETL